MHNLKQTHPHFVRCIIPNELKTGGVLDAHFLGEGEEIGGALGLEFGEMHAVQESSAREGGTMPVGPETGGVAADVPTVPP